MASKKREKEDGGELPWAELPLEVQSNVLGWLPLRPLFRSKRVCKLWNSTISSPSFTHFPSRLTFSGNRPWLIFFTPKTLDFLLAFDFDGYSWFKFDVGFLSSMLDAFHARTPSSPPPASFVWCSGAASGLLLLDFRSSLHVCNPLTKSLVKLSPFTSIEVIVTQGISSSQIGERFKSMKTTNSRARAVMPSTSSNVNSAVQGMDGHNENHVTKWRICATEMKGKEEGATEDEHLCLHSHDFTVVVIGKAKGELAIEAYSLSRNSWDIVGRMPTYFIIRHDQMIECNESFYSLLLTPIGMLVVGESNDEGTACWRIQAIPANYGKETHRLLACRNTIFMVCPVDVHNDGFVIWQYLTNSRGWIKLCQMPEYILEDVKSMSGSNFVDCVGVGNFICFRALGTLRVLTYDLCNELWSWLPVPSLEYDTIFARGLQFEPRLDYTQFL